MSTVCFFSQYLKLNAWSSCLHEIDLVHVLRYSADIEKLQLENKRLLDKVEILEARIEQRNLQVTIVFLPNKNHLLITSLMR